MHERTPPLSNFQFLKLSLFSFFLIFWKIFFFHLFSFMKIFDSVPWWLICVRIPKRPSGLRNFNILSLPSALTILLYIYILCSVQFLFFYRNFRIFSRKILAFYFSWNFYILRKMFVFFSENLAFQKKFRYFAKPQYLRLNMRYVHFKRLDLILVLQHNYNNKYFTFT